MTRKVHVSQRHFGGKTRQPSSFYCGLRQKCQSGENKLSTVRSSMIIIFRSKECLIPFNKSNLAIFYGKKGKMKLPGVSNFFLEYEKKSEVESRLRSHTRIKRSLLFTLESDDTWYIRIAQLYALSLSCLQHLEFRVKQQITYHTEKRVILSL